MKPLLNGLLYAFSCSLFLMSCAEIPPIIGEGTCQTERVVLIEEFTGVRCVNCPAGARKIKQLITQYSEEKLIAVSIHSGSFAVPYEAQEDYKIEAGRNIADGIGPITSYPMAIVNRKQFSGESQRGIGISKWAGFINREFCFAPQVSINIQNDYDTNTRVLNSTINIEGVNTPIFEQAIGLTVYITENKIESKQLDEHGLDSNYMHEHVLRHSFMNNAAGLLLHGSNSPFNEKTLSFSHTLPAHWKAEDCQVIAIVHYRGEQQKYEVLQAAMRKLY